jgi:acetolactate synthase I/II/III large subunit
MDLETAARGNIPILSILFNNSVMAAELNVMKYSTEKFQSTAISGNYADFAKALGCYGERVTEPGAIVPAIKRAVAKIKDGQPALLEFITERQSPRSSEVTAH